MAMLSAPLARMSPITASTRIRIGENRFIVSPVRLEGLPLVGAFPLQLPDLELPVNLPLGLSFTDVTTEPGCIVLTFGGRDVRFLAAERATEARPTPKPRRAVEPPEDAA